MKTKSVLKPNFRKVLNILAELDDADEQYQGKWRNQWFLKDGRWGWGNTVYDTEYDAYAAGEACVGEYEPTVMRYMLTPDLKGQIVYHVDEHSHFIPMPWKDKE